MSKGYYQLNPCLVCDSTSKKCRGKEDHGKEFIQCMTFADTRKGQVINGYKCIKPSNNGYQHNSATFVLDNSEEWTEQQREEWRTLNALRKADARLQDKVKRENSLTADQRHKEYSKILDSLKLDITTVSDLKKRGFTENEINDCGFVSVEAWHKLPFAVDPRLPGISAKNSLIVSGDGYLCPLTDYDGKKVALQLRLHSPDDSGRYRWLSSSAQTLALDVGGTLENPLTVFKPEHPTGIAIVEGTGAKPFLASRRLNNIVIGAAGGQFAGSPKLLKEYLRRASQDVNSKEVVIYPDAADILNKSVMTRWEQVASLIISFGYNVKFAWWSQISKTDSDIDELTDFSQIKYLNLDEFLSLAFIDLSVKEAKQESISNWAWEQWVKSRKFTADITMTERYFQFPVIPDTNAMISVKASLGKGKTEAIIRMILASGNGVHIIGYRNNLLYQTIKRAEKDGLNIFHLNDDSELDYLLDKFSAIDKWAYCLDSAYKLEGYFVGRDIILDESCSVLIHALNGGTLGDNQAKAIRILSTALKECNRVFLLDGNNSDLYTNFYHSLCPDKKLVKIKNTHGSPKHNIKIVDAVSDGEIKSRNRTPLIEMLLDKEVIPWIYCDSKERTKIIHQILIEGGKRGYCLNSETAGDDWAKEFLADPDKFILDKKPDYIIVSPTAESGISAGDDSKKAEEKRNKGEVTLNGYFTDKFTFFAGVTGTNGQIQAMFRLRDESINHYVFCPEQSMAKDRNSPHTYSIKQYQNILNDRILQSSMLASESANNPTRALEIIGNAIARTKDDWWEMSAKLGVIDNYEMNNLRKCLIHALEEAGHNVEIVQIEASEELKKAESEAKVTVQKTHAKEFHAANEFATLEAAQKAAKANPRKDTQRRIEKTFFLDRLPEIKNSPLWGEDFIYETHIKRKEYIRNIERYWFVKNFDVSQKRHESRWFYEATKEDFYSARVSNMTHSVIWALRQLDIMKFTDGREYHKNSGDVLNLIQQLRDSKDIRIALKMESMPPATETGNENLSIISSLLNKIGFQNKSQGQKFVGDIRLRHYQAVPTGYKEELEDGEFDLLAAREDILAAIGKRFMAWMQSEKAVIDWEESEAKLTNQCPIPNPQSPIPNNLDHIVAALQSATDWGQVAALPQELINEAWSQLTPDDDARLRQLHQQYQQPQPQIFKRFLDELGRYILLSNDGTVATVQSLLTNEQIRLPLNELELAA
jgi:hypothetical protein